MPTIEENRKEWNTTSRWLKLNQGEEWSSAWGGSEAQWFGAIFPRIHTFIPTDTILEIAPGFGRWTNYLKAYCKRLVVVDLAETCIDVCKQRFASESHITYHVNDGKSLAMIPDESIDFVFSFDSLVHAEADVLEAYLDQLAKKLKKDGIGFIHHSNIGEYRDKLSVAEKVPSRLRTHLINKGWLVSNPHWRALSVTARLFEQQCDRAGLQCISQELINWDDKLLNDAFSTFTKKGSIWDRPNRVLRNPNFAREANFISQLSRLYIFSGARSCAWHNHQ